MATAPSTVAGNTDMIGIPSAKFFSSLAATYAKQTGNSTRDIFVSSLDAITSLHPITPSSRIHDNAAGPGTAASVLASTFPAASLPEIVITDSVPAMVSAARDAFASLSPAVTAQEMDSHALAFPDAHFTHSLLNFSVFAMADPPRCLREMHRTLRPGGVAAVLTWRRFAAGALVRAAQAMVRPDLPPMHIPHEEMMAEGVLSKLVVEAGFAEEGVQVLEKRVVVKGEDLEGLRGFLVGENMLLARKGWTEEEERRWPEVVEKVVRDEVEAEGGVLFEAWVVLARK
ncbi:S-adenosyl-L-methionine-dependent methyltransferase [Madurella fahalii]|uniref:S-adenosyl-L-methionine-dependent methyltransferase n=1 Tax=Madurella fahalii TaxID=1157608 RepID=A0ABQ0GCN5_9PEZI